MTWRPQGKDEVALLIEFLFLNGNIIRWLDNSVQIGCSEEADDKDSIGIDCRRNIR